MDLFNPTDHPHRRFNALTGDWILVSPHRTKRPWQGQVERPPQETRPAYDPTCYLCSGNERAGGKRNPDYTSTFVFTNDFAALLPDSPAAPAGGSPLMRCRKRAGYLPGDLLLAAPRSDPAGDARRGHSPSGGRVGGADRRAWASSTAGCRFSRTRARSWAAPTRTRTGRSGPAARCPTSRPRRTASSAPTSSSTARRCCSIMRR